MMWSEVKTATQMKNLVTILVNKIGELQVTAKESGLLVKLKLSPDRSYLAGDIGDREEWDLFLCPGGQLEYEHYKTWRAYDEWESRSGKGEVVTEEELIRFIQLCHIETSRIDEVSKSLRRRANE